MKKNNFNEVAVSTLTGLLTNLMQKLSKGVITIVQFEKFLNSSPEKRDEFFGTEREISTFFQKSDFFKNCRLEHDFEILMKTANENFPMVDVPKYETLTEVAYDENIFAQYGKEVMIQPIDKILSEIHAIISSKDKTFADGYATFWYTRYNDGVFFVLCHWDSSYRVWCCNVGKVIEDKYSPWFSGHRMVLPANL